MNKLDRKDFTIAVKTGSDANKVKFAKEAVKGEAYYATDSQNLYFAQTTAGASDAFLSKITPSELAYDNQLSLNLDGTNDYVTILGASDLSISGDCSISAWFNPSSVSGYNYIFSLTDGRSTGVDRAFGLSGAQMVANTYASGWNLPFTHTAIATGSWYHAVVVFTSGTARMYLNGSDLGTKSVTTNTVSYTQTVIGGMLYSSSNHFNGKIDEVVVFDSALSASDITSIYNNGANYIGSFNPVGWWRMGDNDGGIGTTITDQGSGGNNGTLANGPTFSTDVPS